MAEQISVTERAKELLKLYPRTGDALLVAGQALATWVNIFAIPLPDALASGVTRDLDYLANRDLATEHHDWLVAQGFDSVLYLPGAGDITPNSAKIVVKNVPELAEDIVIDYMQVLCGFNDELDEERLHARSVRLLIEDAGIEVRLMHPFDCLKSRVHNIYQLPSKRNQAGLAQLELAIVVLYTYLAQAASEGQEIRRQVVLPIVEKVIELAESRAGRYVYRTFRADLMKAVPVEIIGGKFQDRRWPHAVRYIDRRRRGRRGGLCSDHLSPDAPESPRPSPSPREGL